MNIMDTISLIFQIIIPLGIFNVWLIRIGKSTSYRGGDAQSLKEEFAVYGLPDWAFYVIGALKLSAAVALLLGFFIPYLIFPGALLMAALMLGALAMHLKVKDPMAKSLPASLMLLMCLVLLF